MDLKELAKEVFETEANEILEVSKRIDSNFEKAVEQILINQGKVIISGIGKSGIIGRKISATFASTGTPSFFLHPSEAYHGDLGMIGKDDTIILISNSGETDEILKILPFLKDQGNTLISLCGKENSTLVKNSDFFIDIMVRKEACPLQLAPTSSSTATLVMGDALAIALMKRKEFKDENFAKFHPGGSLGRKLLWTVKNVMRDTDLPIVSETDSIKKIIQEISKGKSGLVIVTDKNDIKGVITDGDIRRAMESNEENFFSLTAKNIMTLDPKTISSSEKLINANKKMNEEKISSLLVVDADKKLIGIIQLFDTNF